MYQAIGTDRATASCGKPCSCRMPAPPAAAACVQMEVGAVGSQRILRRLVHRLGPIFACRDDPCGAFAVPTTTAAPAPDCEVRRSQRAEHRGESGAKGERMASEGPCDAVERLHLRLLLEMASLLILTWNVADVPVLAAPLAPGVVP